MVAGVGELQQVSKREIIVPFYYNQNPSNLIIGF